MRRERSFRAGTRVRLDAPGHSFHGKLGTVAQDVRAESACFVLRDGYGRVRRGIATLATCEVARLRDQTPNPEHAGTFKDFWWIGAE